MSITLQVKGDGPFEVIESDEPIAGYRTMTRAEYQALAASYVPPAPVLPPEPLRQTGATVIRRLTDAELVALDASRHPAAIRAKMLAQSEGLISQADPDFAALTAALDQLGIIAASRWPVLLAP